MELHGIIKSVGEVQQKTADFSIVEVDLDISTYQQDTGKKFENYARVQFMNEKINLLMNFSIGDRVKVRYNIKGNYYTNAEGKPFFAQNLNATKIERI